MERFKICKLISKEVIKKYNVKKPSSLKFFAISYFFDMALEENLITSKVFSCVAIQILRDFCC